ncbi:PAS domain-containing sensor histidine kinase [Methanolobus sp. WCC4]|uniref:PAS domain-containing sensor histidine kinase n=1 Tax=Methanolobus sp. WCC4 TaxID=3125784 RepID=UPI0030F96F35
MGMTQGYEKKDDKLLAEVFMSLSDSIAVLDVDGTIIATNHKWKDFTAKGDENNLRSCSEGTNYLKVCGGRRSKSPVPTPDMVQGIADVINGKSKIFEAEHPCCRSSDERWCMVRVVPLKNTFPTPVLVYHIDITEKKIIERESHSFRDMIEQSADGIIFADKDFKIRYINRACEELYGWKLEEVIGMMPDKLIGGDLISVDKQHEVYSTISSGKTFSGERVNYRKDGTAFICKFMVSPLYAEDGDIYGYLGSQTDITDYKKAKEKLQENDKMFQVLYENMPGGTLIIGRDYIIKDVNNRTCEITGYKREELVGQLCDIICPKGSASKKCPIWEEGKEGFMGMDTAVKCKDGRKNPILKNAKRTVSDDEIYILENFQDISELKTIQEELLNSKIVAEEANRAKSDFLTTMSHELRTPLNSIIGFSQMLGERRFGELNGKQERYVSNIATSGKHLLNLINNILDISKVEAGKMELICEEFDVTEVFEDIENLIYPFSSKKDINISINAPSESLLIYADKTKFKQIMYNLLNNAVKFTPSGGYINVSANYIDSELHIMVEDNGIGISESNLELIFHPFRQIDSATSREFEGTGLGLALVKNFVELHGGRIHVESEPGEGSTFKFFISEVNCVDN